MINPITSDRSQLTNLVLYGHQNPISRCVTESHSLGLIRRREPPTWFHLATEKLQAAATLQDNWDSYGALRTNSLSLHHAYQFLECICRTVGVSEPLIAVNANGNVCFEFEQNAALELEVLPSGKVVYYFVDRDGAEEKGENQSPFKDVLDRLTKF